MTVVVMSADECEALALSTLGLADAGFAITSTEAIAASLRRAASFLCPCPPRRIVDAVLEVIRPLAPEDVLKRHDVMTVLDLIVAGGDLVELRPDAARATRLLYLGPPTYVQKEPGLYLIAGVRPYGEPLIEADRGWVEYYGHTRMIAVDDIDARNVLRGFGLQSVSPQRWVGQPAVVAASELLAATNTRLDGGLSAGAFAPQYSVIDPQASVTYYRGRWRPLVPADAGIFVARRPQAYGADVWCVLRVSDGVPQRIVDFPIDDPGAAGRDEAWRLQAAIDAELGHPQRVRTRHIGDTGSDVILDFFSPLPGWAERRIQLAAYAVDRSAGALVSFRASPAASHDLQKYLSDMLWVQPTDGEL